MISALILHLLALWPIAATVPFVRRSNLAWRAHLRVLKATPLAATRAQRSELRTAQDAHAQAERRAAMAVAAALTLIITEFIVLSL